MAATSRTSNGTSSLAADGAHRADLEGAKQLRLHLERHLAELVEEERALVRLDEEPLAVGAGVGESAADVTEQLALEQVGGHGGAVDGDHRPVVAAAAAMQGARGELLAGSCLAR